jgi:hypothetical protein
MTKNLYGRERIEAKGQVYPVETEQEYCRTDYHAEWATTSTKQSLHDVSWEYSRVTIGAITQDPGK